MVHFKLAEMQTEVELLRALIYRAAEALVEDPDLLERTRDPEALSEKVINKQSLVKNTFNAKVGDKLDVNFLGELLGEYDFEKTDFVYEAGQYAVRGGIVDVFPTTADHPLRIEFDGDEIADSSAELGAINRRILRLARAQSADIEGRLKEVGIAVVHGRGRLAGRGGRPDGEWGEEVLGTAHVWLESSQGERRGFGRNLARGRSGSV